MKFNDFVANLKNFEKSRDKNVFSGYSLETFNDIYSSLTHHFRSHAKFKISIVGTNGKGSTAHYLGEIFQRCNQFKNIGIFTSPHLVSQYERICINSIPVREDEADEILSSFTPGEIDLLKKLSYFEIFTLFSFIVFFRHHCEIEIFEAGLGGRLDATKIANPNFVILTAIGNDHTNILGDTKEKILIEKLGIIGSKATHLFALNQNNDKLNNIIEKYCATNNLSLSFFTLANEKDYLQNLMDFSIYIYNNIMHLLNLECGVNLTNLPSPPGRMEVLHSDPLVIFDTAHNADAIKSLIHSITIRYPDLLWTFIFTCLKDKDIESMMSVILATNIFKTIYVIQGEEFAQLDTKIEHQSIKTIGLNELKKIPQNENILAFGSFRIYQPLLNLIN